MQTAILAQNDILEKADRVKISIETIRVSSQQSRIGQILLAIRHILLTPGELFALGRIFILLGDSPDWLSYIRYNHFLIAFATLTYILAWYYSFPLLVAIWDLFHSANWDKFFQRLFSWGLFQSLLAMSIRYFFEMWAIDSFTILPEMFAEYEAIQRLRQEQRLTQVVHAQIRNDLLRVVPGIVQNSLAQAIAMSPLSGMDDASFERLQGQLSSLICNLLEERTQAIAIESREEEGVGD